jgi:hypothetical protein
MQCSKCQRLNPDVERFCAYCGNPLIARAGMPLWAKWTIGLLVAIAIIVPASVMLPKFLGSSPSTQTTTQPPTLPATTSKNILNPAGALADAHVPVLNTKQTPSSTSTRQVLECRFTQTPPTIDGLVSPEEWSDGFSVSKSIAYRVDNVDKKGELKVSLLNDNTHLYAAVRIIIPDLQKNMLENNLSYFRLDFIYDSNGDGSIKPNEIFREFSLLNPSKPIADENPVIFRRVRLSSNGGISFSTQDEGLTKEGVFKYSESTKSYDYELEILLDSNENNLIPKPGDKIIVKVEVWQQVFYNNTNFGFGGTGWPESGLIDFDTYGDLELAQEPNADQTQPIAATSPLTPTPSSSPFLPSSSSISIPSSAPITNSVQNVCDQIVIDEAGVFDSGADSVQNAVNQLIKSGADVRVRTIQTYGNAGNLDWYEAQLEQQCLSWADTSGNRKNNLVVILVAIKERQTGIYYGSQWEKELGNSWTQIQSEIMNPRFVRGDFAGGVIDGIQEINRLIQSP